MKFGEKYELLESLTTGAVETFIANDKVRGTRVLVHILDCGPQRPNQATVQWVLEGFRRLAPEPVSLVLETGKYSGTLYAYLVTEMPDESGLRIWVDSYNKHAADTQESTAPTEKPAPESPTAVQEIAAKEPPSPVPVSVPFTQMFRDYDSQAKARAPIVEHKIVERKEAEAPMSPPPSLPPLPLPNLGVAGGPSGLHSAPPWDPGNSSISVPAREETLKTRGGVDAPVAEVGPNRFPTETLSSSGKSGPKPGEFTSFFQGPFRGDTPSEIPSISREPAPPGKKVGEFTAMFGAPMPPPERPAPALEPALENDAPRFTDWFDRPPDPVQPLPPAPLPITPPSSVNNSNVGDSSFSPQPARDPFFPPPPPVYVTPVPPPYPAPLPQIPLPPAPVVEKPPAVPAPVISPSSGGATRAFQTMANEPVPTPPPVAHEESAYTKIISVRPAESTDAKQPAAHAQTAAGSFPSMPIPKIKPPAMPAPPKLPQLKIPAPPPPPKAPKVAPPSPVSWWPLIFTLTVIFFVAVLLVLYFWLKH
jgi:hypothetical protein